MTMKTTILAILSILATVALASGCGEAYEPVCMPLERGGVPSNNAIYSHDTEPETEDYGDYVLCSGLQYDPHNVECGYYVDEVETQEVIYFARGTQPGDEFLCFYL